MHSIQAVITGAVQGLSEFLPISSSAHIVFSNELYELITHAEAANALDQEEIFFDIMVHLATLAAVIFYFFNDLKIIFKDFFISLKQKNYNNENFKLFNCVIISTIITGIVGLLLKHSVEKLMIYPKIICFLLVITGVILLISEKFYKGNKNLTYKNSLLIALAQGLAVCPGFSRSGFTISAAMIQGIDRIKSAKFSFLMSIPVIILASLIYPIFELDFSQIAHFNHKAIILGTITSFIVGYLCIKYFMQLLKKISLKFFGFYCIFASIIMFTVFEFFYRQ